MSQLLPVSAPSSLIDGMLVINKPVGMISKDVTRWLEKRLPKKPKIGHVGTLDPIAEGVLPLLIGRATRLQDFLLDLDKSYQFEVQFGVSTDTLDTDGQPLGTGPTEHIQLSEIESIVADMEGDLFQVPPLYSAVKYKGTPLYKYARSGRGAEVPLESLGKTVHLKSFKVDWLKGAKASFQVVCSKGTYVRSLAESVSSALGTCGIVSKLVRTQSAGVYLTDAITLEELDANITDINSYIISASELNLSIPRWKACSDIDIRKLQRGQKIKVDVNYFEEGFSEPDCRGALDASDGMIALTDESGKSFGLGVASFVGSSFLVSMRRSFS